MGVWASLLLFVSFLQQSEGAIPTGAALRPVSCAFLSSPLSFLSQVLDGIALGTRDHGHLALNAGLATSGAAAFGLWALRSGWGHGGLLWALAASYGLRGLLHLVHLGENEM